MNRCSGIVPSMALMVYCFLLPLQSVYAHDRALITMLRYTRRCTGIAQRCALCIVVGHKSSTLYNPLKNKNENYLAQHLQQQRANTVRGVIIRKLKHLFIKEAHNGKHLESMA
jgi:hypothetical protein